MDGTFLGLVLSTLSEFTLYKCAMLVTPSELDDYCARFHGIQSMEFAGETEHSFSNPDPITDSAGNTVPLIECKDVEITRQFYALNYPSIEQLMECCDDPPLLAKQMNKYIHELRHRTPPIN